MVLIPLVAYGLEQEPVVSDNTFGSILGIIITIVVALFCYTVYLRFMEKREGEIDEIRKMIKEVNENVLKLEKRLEELSRQVGR